MPVSVASHTILRAKVQPLTTPQDGEAFRGGVVLGESELERRLRHNRAGIVSDAFDLNAQYLHAIAGEWVYGGFLYPHFGHFMSEVVHRVVASRLIHPDAKFLFAGSWSPDPTSTIAQVPAMLQDILHLLEIDESNFIAINRPSIVECLHIVEQAADLGGAPKHGYLDALATYIGGRIRSETAGSRVKVAAKIYVSRSKLPPGGAVLGETYIEEQVAASGVSIFHPEDHPFIEQLRHYSEAERVVFHEGSACHGTELLGAEMMGDVGLIVRRPEVGRAFDAVLRPRAKTYAAFFETNPLGSIVVTREGGAPQLHLGVAVAAPTRLAEYLRHAFSLSLVDFNPSDFLHRSRQDLARYQEFHRLHGTITTHAGVASFLENANSVLDGVAQTSGLE